MTLTQNEIREQVTTRYLDAINITRRPSPSLIEAELIEQVNKEFRIENVGRALVAGDKADSNARNQIALLKTLSNWQIAEILKRLHRVVLISPAGKNRGSRDYDLLAVYIPDGPEEGIYATSETQIRAVARQYNRDLSINDTREVMTILRESVDQVSRCDDRDLVAVQNGLFNYRTKELGDFSPDFVFVSKVPIEYDATAASPVIQTPDGDVWEVEDWMRTLSDDEEVVELLWEIIGAVIRPHVRWNQSAWFYSEQGNNGKGTLVEMMRNMLGERYASIPIGDFSKDFLLEPLTRSQAILVDENDVGSFIDKAANLKAVITNDVISINQKYKAPINYQFWGFMVQCLNEFPKFKDKSESFYRRQLFVPFLKSFTGAERRHIKDDYVGRDDVLQYVLKRVLHMDYYVLSEPEACRLVLNEYKEYNDPVRAFWNEFEDQFAWDFLPFPFLYDLFKAWFASTNPSGHPVAINSFTKDLCVVAEKSAIWSTEFKGQKNRPGKRMSAPEPLIAGYELKEWMPRSYSGADHIRLSITDRTDSSYRALVRRRSLSALPFNEDDAV